MSAANRLSSERATILALHAIVAQPKMTISFIETQTVIMLGLSSTTRSLTLVIVKDMA